MQKVNRWHVLAIGVVLIAGVGAAAFFLMIKPKQEEIAKLKKDIEACDNVIAQKQKAEDDLKKFTAQLGEVRKELEAYKSRFVTIRYENTDRPAQYATMVRVWSELREQLEPAFEKFVPAVSGCEFAGLRLPSPPTQLSQITPPASGFLRIPQQGSLTLSVTGRLEDITKLLRSLHQFSRLITVGPPTISGTSPTLRASMPIAFYVIAEIPEGHLTGPTASFLSGGGGAGAGGGMPGMGSGMPGMGGGMPGMAGGAGGEPGMAGGEPAMAGGGAGAAGEPAAAGGG